VEFPIIELARLRRKKAYCLEKNKNLFVKKSLLAKSVVETKKKKVHCLEKKK